MAEKTGNKDVLIDGLIDLAGQTAIVHHIPERIRLQVKLPGLLLARLSTRLVAWTIRSPKSLSTRIREPVSSSTNTNRRPFMKR